MLYVITDMLLKVSLNTKKTVHHAMHERYSQHIVESGVQHQSNQSCRKSSDLSDRRTKID